MKRTLRKILGIAGFGLNWGIVWGVLLAVLVAGIGLVRPQDVDAGEGPFPAGVIGFKAGCLSGLIFGLIVALAENRKPLAGLNILRFALWGALASLVWPLVSRVPGDIVLAHCLLGGAYAALSVALARAFILQRSRPSLLFTVLGRSVRDPLRATCGPEGPART